MTAFVITNTSGIAIGLFCSVLWLWLLRRIRPRIKISSKIAEKVDPELGPSRFYIKISNLRRRAAVDLQIELVTLHLKQASNGEIYAKTMIPIQNALPFVLPGRDADCIYGHVLRLAIRHDLRAELANGEATIVQLRIYARDELSGMGRVFEKRYTDPETDLIQGAFSPGETYEIH
ncbi:hypothetical protein [Stackebrandtia nassauensis]|nr:hypothetical protein [Stackebrandtia nassauensis]